SSVSRTEMTSLRGWRLKGDFIVDRLTYNCYCGRSHRMPLPGRMQEEFFRACRRPGASIIANFSIPEELPHGNGFVIPTRDLGAHRAALRRCGNRRNVEPECR